MHASYESTPFHHVELVAGNADLLVSRKVILVEGQNLAAGAVLGKITSGGKYALSLSASSDGSQAPDAILAHAVDATAEDTEALVYVRGDFNEGALTIGTGHTADSIREGLRTKGITLISTVGV